PLQPVLVALPFRHVKPVQGRLTTGRRCVELVSLPCCRSTEERGAARSNRTETVICIGRKSMLKSLMGGALAATALVMLSSTAIAEPEVVSGPSADPECFAPWTAETKFFKFPKKEGPYRIALANGYIANTWRIQMIQTAKAYAAQPDVAIKLKEFQVVSTGEDVRAQISAINNFIDSGYDAIVVNAQNPTAF